MARKERGPATMAMHHAVARHLDHLSAVGAAAGPVVLGCSGGADSLALAVVSRGVIDRRAAQSLTAVIIDHRLQAGSAATAATVRDQLDRHGVVAEVIMVDVGAGGRADGPEAAARSARYAALTGAAVRLGAACVLLGHTRDDQAETVLLGLARGSGARSLAGMAASRVVAGTEPPVFFGRPLLGLARSVTEAACAELGLHPWTDPHNTDPDYARVRVRHRVLPVLEEELGPGVTEALARTADQLRADADLLDQLAGQAYARVVVEDALACEPVVALAPSLRSRVVRRFLLDHGAHEVSAAHLDAVAVLLDDWRGQRGIDLPGIRVVRDHGVLRAVAG